jgi:hypothetical protein
MGLLDIQCKETSMGENKGHSDKNPSYPELDDMGSAASRAGINAGNQQSAGGPQDIGNQQSGDLQGSNQQSNLQNDQQQGNKQQGSKQASSGSQQQGGQQQGGQQQGGQQQGQSQQHGGQHASGGTPALDDRDSKQGNLQSASQKDALQTDWDNLQDKHR